MKEKTRNTWAAVIGLTMLIAADAAIPDDRVLDDDAWRADIESVADTIRENHPRPYRTVSEAEFGGAVQQLLDEVPDLSDKAIVVRLAALVAMLDDGHTRLSIPRQHPELGLEFGHTATQGPEHDELRFQQLPLALEQFDDGVFVVAANREHANLIGLRLVAIDDVPVEEAMQAVQAITFAENRQLEVLMGVDRLTLPEALVQLGVARDATSIGMALVDRDGVRSAVEVRPLSSAPVDWVDAFDDAPSPLRLEHPGKKFWSEYIADDDFVYMQMDEIGDGEILLAEFVTKTIAEALERDAKLVIDVRNNFGGSSGLNRTLVTSIIANDALNRRDRTFVLVGRRTFSAAQMLVNELEQYTRATFVGEPTGSSPDHYGDPKKIRLEHSGLTLRVSRLHWSSYTAFDDRDTTNPDFEAGWTSTAYFSGEDPALSAALSINDVSLESLLRAAFERGDIRQVARYTLDSRLSPETYGDDFSKVLLDLGGEFEAAGDAELGNLAYQVGLYFYPDNEELESAAAR